MNAANKPKSPVSKAELNAEDIRLLLTKQKEAWLANRIPDYATRIDRMDQLNGLKSRLPCPTNDYFGQQWLG